jgi:hypothetical protein
VTSAGLFHTIDGTNVDVVGGDLFGFLCRPPAMGNCVDMNGTANSGPNGNPQGVLVSNDTFALRPGNTYTLSYDLVGSDRGVDTSTTVTFGNDTNTVELTSSSTRSNTTVLRPGTPITTSLTFVSNQGGNAGALLDNILLTCSGPTCQAPVPEPASLGLLALGLLGGAGAGFARRKRRN